MKQFVLPFLGILLFVCIPSCRYFEEENSKSDYLSSCDEIVVENGYLYFKTEDSFKDYINSLSDAPNTRSAAGVTCIPGFVSIESRKLQIQTRTSLTEPADDMTKEEYDTYKAESLLIDPVLTSVVDTNLVVRVEDKLYKITPIGTFAINSELGLDSLYNAINNMDTTIVQELGNGEYLEIDDDITFINTYGNNSIESSCFEVFDYGNEPTSADVMNNNLHIGYNTQQYKWKNSSLWQKMWDGLRGKTVSREVSFDSKHRVQVTVFDVNYAFYASSGISVKMQKKRNYLGAKVWTPVKADKFAVGFNYVYGQYNLKSPQSFSAMAPSQFYGYNAIQKTINGKMYDLLCGMYSQVPYIKDWSDKITLYVPSLRFVGGRVLDVDLNNELYNAPIKSIFSFLKSEAGSVIYNPIDGKNRLQTRQDPRMSYFVYGKTEYEYDKERPFIMGVSEYGRKSTKTIRFDTSFGFWFNSRGGFGPMLISSFDIKRIDAFGAVYYAGEWKGVRFTD